MVDGLSRISQGILLLLTAVLLLIPFPAWGKSKPGSQGGASSGSLPLNVHGVGAVVLAHGVWTILAAIGLLRRAPKP